MFQKTHQKQEPIKKHEIEQNHGGRKTNNEGNTQKHKTHGKSKPNKWMIINKQKHKSWGKQQKQKYCQTSLAQNQKNKINIGKTKKNKNKDVQTSLAMGPLNQTSLNIIVCLCLFCFPHVCFCLLILSQTSLKICVCFPHVLFVCCVAALRCGAPLRCSALRCAALSFGVLARTPLSPGLELNCGLASKGEIWEVHSGSRKCNPL